LLAYLVNELYAAQYDGYWILFSSVAPLISQIMRGIPATTEATTITTAIPAAVRDQTNHGAIAATEYWRSSIATRTIPAVGITILFLSFGVEKIEGSPTSNIKAGTTSHFDQSATAQGPAIQAMSSDRNRKLDDAGVSWG
jgi:hypothetical protein